MGGFRHSKPYAIINKIIEQKVSEALEAHELAYAAKMAEMTAKMAEMTAKMVEA